MHNGGTRCGMCGRSTSRLTTINKQLGGEFKRRFVCSDCLEQHKRELEMTRENFRRQFGNN